MTRRSTRCEKCKRQATTLMLVDAGRIAALCSTHVAHVLAGFRI